MHRRAVLHTLTLGAAWPIAGGWLSGDLDGFGARVHAALAVQAPGFKAFDAASVALVTAACDRIIPESDTPGAVAAGVPRFIDTIMADWETPTDRNRFLDGLSALDRDARQRYGRSFAECSAPDQDAMLGDLDRDVAALTQTARAAHWFARLKYLTIYGYCTSEAGVRGELREGQMPGRYDGDAPYAPPRAGTGSLPAATTGAPQS